jgi:2,3-dihydroxybenzoate-AMP ligase
LTSNTIAIDDGKIGVRDPLPGVVYPDPARLRQYVDAGLLGRVPLGAAFHEAALKYADRIALVDHESGRTISYRELDELSDRFGAALLDIGFEPRDRIIFQVGNIEELFVCLYGCFKAGLVPVATLPNHREREIGFIADFVAARGHIVQANFRRGELPAFAETMAGQCATLEHLIRIGGEDGQPGRSYAGLIDSIDPKAARERLAALDIDPFDIAMFQLSGGTTGIPKIIPRFHNEYLYNMNAWADASAYDQDTRIFWPLPIIHNAGIVCGAPPAHLRGGLVVLQQSIEPDAILDAVSANKVTMTVASIPLIVRMIDAGVVGKYDISSVRDLISAGETPLVERTFGVPGHHIFGMSEGLCMRTAPHYPQAAREACVGQPISDMDEVKLLHPETEIPVDPGEVGEFCCRGPYTIAGYFNAVEHNAKAFTADGFYRSGDLMRAHEIEGQTYYSFEGRIKDNIDRGGEKISAEEVERAVIEHASVREVAVIGMPDREFGERVCAYVIPEAGSAVPGIAELGAFLGERGLARYKHPERIEIVETFPVTKVGKVSKPDLKADIAKKLGG